MMKALCYQAILKFLAGVLIIGLLIFFACGNALLLERMKALCKEQNGLYVKQKDLKEETTDRK